MKAYHFITTLFAICLGAQGESETTQKPLVTFLPPDWNDPAVVTIPGLGTIQGGVNLTFPLVPKSRKFYFFAGIPYANPESYTKTNRFRPSKLWEGPLPLEPEKKAFQATDFSVKCPQSEFIADPMEGQGDETQETLDFLGSTIHQQTEECLVININTPMIPKGSRDETLLPVILFVHGGGFDSSWSGRYRGHRFLAKDVVFVTINYRLGLLGSLNLGIDDAPGNAALYDVITALKWIQSYIGHFGGNKSSVTLAGYSAGAVLATHLLTSDLSVDEKSGEPLLHRIVGLSGSSLSQWMAILKEPIPEHLHVSKLAGCDNVTAENHPDFKAIRDCMAEKPVNDLIQALNILSISEVKQGRMGLDAKLPSLQSTQLSIPKVLSETPYNVLKDKKQKLDIPVMMGTTRHDGSYLVDKELELFWRPNNYVDDPIYLRNQLIPTLVESLDLDDPSGEMIHSLEYLYMGDGMISDDFESKIPGLIDVFSVLAFKAGAYQLVELNAKKNAHSYYFSFDYSGMCSAGGSLAIPGGVGHMNSLFYLFPTQCPIILPGDLKVSERFVDYWVNFATYGNPNGATVKTLAPPYNPLNHAYLKIRLTDITSYYCRDAWVGNSLELIKDASSTTSPTRWTSDAPPTTPASGTTKKQEVYHVAVALLSLTTIFFWRDILISLL